VSEPFGFDLSGEGSWEERLAHIVGTVRELSHAFEPQAMVERYAERMQDFMPARRLLTATRRGFEPPRYGFARLRSWEEKAELPHIPSALEEMEGGLLGELLFAGEPRIIEELCVAPDDPAARDLAGQGSLIAIPVFEHGVAVEMVIHTRDRPHAFNPERFPEMVWLTNVLARAAFYASRTEELRRAHGKLDRDVAYLARLQQSLLPAAVPDIPGTRVALRYQPSERSGGDYYDFFPLPDGRFGILLADISGHGTVTAVLMAITHAIAHLYPRAAARPSSLLGFLNRHLAARYTAGTNTFVTAFHAIYDPVRRRLSYALAGHPAPRLLRDGKLSPLDRGRGPPLGLWVTQRYADTTVEVRPGDDLVLFTDGITEARDADGRFFGEERLDEALRSDGDLDGLVDGLSSAVADFAGERRSEDDWTIVALNFL
jgi:sigma-B regulation protein RsbU (phosphoserine phosphatase)